jgi:hypothetical protein
LAGNDNGTLGNSLDAVSIRACQGKQANDDMSGALICSVAVAGVVFCPLIAEGGDMWDCMRQIPCLAFHAAEFGLATPLIQIWGRVQGFRRIESFVGLACQNRDI